ncbi:M61 family metallopeptidase [Castellaniella sp.]|uniref:M61 family metallopeptidase n=1 Tax=Castellaniella sp. TaxID=1955812 RepID=UPI00355FE7FE
MKNSTIRYQVRLADPAGHRFAITLTIPRPEPGGQILRLPAWIPGSYLIRDFARQIESLLVFDADGPVGCHKTDSHTWQCAPAQGRLTVEYTVYAWDLSVRGAHFDESHAFFNGSSLFLAVVGQEDQPCLLDLCPPGHTDRWRVFTSLPEAEGEPGAAARHGFGCYRAPDHDALLDHPVEMGTPQCVSFEAHGTQHELVFTGVVPGLDLARIAQDVQKICQAQIEFFEPETRQAPFLDSASRYVFLVMVTADGYGGLEHRASTALITSRADLPTTGQPEPEDYKRFLGLVSHEYFHTWHVKRIKPAAFAPYCLDRPNFTRLLWVFEGFTSYYDDLMLLRAGVIDEPAYFGLLARTMDGVLRGAGRHKQSVAESSFDAWTRYYKQDENSPNALVSYYTKGALVALGLDLEIRQRTADRHSLDDVMRLLWKRHGRGFYDHPPQGVPETAMQGLILEATGVDVSDFIARHVDGREDVPLKDALARTGITLEASPADQRPDLDVRTHNDAGGVRLATVYEHGPAHLAGLSAGDLLIAIDGLRVTSDTALKQLLASHRPGDRVVVHVFRRDELRRYRVQLASARALKHRLRRVDGPPA